MGSIHNIFHTKAKHLLPLAVIQSPKFFGIKSLSSIFLNFYTFAVLKKYTNTID